MTIMPKLITCIPTPYAATTAVPKVAIRGAMITFELKGGRVACDTFIKKISRLIPYSATLGDPETILIHVPTVFTEERFPFPGMMRLSVGYVAFKEVEKCIFDALDTI